MPTVIKSTSNISKLGELSTYTVSNAATPADPTDSSGSVPGFSAVLANGADTDLLIGETLTLSNPAISAYAGEIIAVNKAANSARYSLDANTLLARLNNDVRVYPLNDVGFVVSTWNPLAAIEYWTQQMGVLYDKVGGDVLFYQSQCGHGGAYVKGISRVARNTYLSGAAEGAGFALLGNRKMLGYGRSAEVDVQFTPGEYPALMIPSTGSSVMVFGSIIYLNGTGRTGYTTWNFIDAAGNLRALRLTTDTAAGFSVSTSENGSTFTSLGTLPVTGNGAIYRVYLSVASVSSTQTQFTLQAFDTNNALKGTVQATATTGIRGLLSLMSVIYTSASGGSGTLTYHYGDFISVMKSMPTGSFPVQKSLTAGYKTAGPLIGFSGNAWDHIKQYCSLYHLEISCANGIITVGPRPKEITSGVSLSTLGTKIQARDQARYVEVVNQQHTSTNNNGTSVTPKVLWKADTVYQVAVGEVQTFTVQTKHSILNTWNPVCVSGISPYPYTDGGGQYVVTGSDGYIVSPSFWAAQGGSITADTTENEGEIKITIKGPDYDSPRAPYRISEGDAGRPALYISGEGVLCDPVTLRVSTGNTTAAKEVGVTLDSPFIGTTGLAYDAAMAAAVKYAVPAITASIAEPTGSDAPSALGQIPTAGLIRRNGNILRVTDTSQTKSGLTGNASQHNTIYQINNSYGSATIGQMNALQAGKTIGQLNVRPLKN